jgi:hypothetical protein
MRILASFFAVLLLAACATTGGGAVDEVHLFGMPAALNLDSKPGADGFAVRVYLTKVDNAKGATLRNGALEILMFDGLVAGNDLFAKPPAQTWKFSPSEITRFEEVTSLGHGYRFALRWSQPPKSPHITVLARYIPAKGEPIYSPPSTISSAIK